LIGVFQCDISITFSIFGNSVGQTMQRCVSVNVSGSAVHRLVSGLYIDLFC